MFQSRPRLEILFVEETGAETLDAAFNDLIAAMTDKGAIDPRVLPRPEPGERDPLFLVAGARAILATLSSLEVIAAVLAVVVAHLLRDRERSSHPIKAKIQVGSSYYEVSGSTVEEVEKEARRIQELIVADPA